MSQIETSSRLAVGLDVGTSRICVALSGSQEFTYRTELNAFVSIPFSTFTASVLKRERIPHTIAGANIVVHGNESERFADLLDMETRRTMSRGTLNPSEPESLAVMRQILESLVGRGDGRTKLRFTIPAAPLGAEENNTYHEVTLRQMLTEMGYEVAPVNEGLAIIYSDLEATNYTGIGVSCGGGLCNVCLAYLAVPIQTFSTTKAGDEIDQNAASVTGERANRLRMLKEESFHINGSYPDKLHQAIGVYYDEMIQALVGAMKQSFVAVKNMPKFGRPIPLVLSGGTALPKGFKERFQRVLRSCDFPLPISEVRLAMDPLRTSARGALVAALSEN